MEQPLVSVVMPAYNSAGYIEPAIRSILDQTYPFIELIVVDDASTDETTSIIQRLSDDKRIIVATNETNLGIVHSRNKGISMAQGAFIAIMDSDDISLPDRLERQVSYMQKHPELGAIGSFYHVIDGDSAHITSVTVPYQPKDTATFLLFNVCFCHSTLMMRGDIARSFLYRPGFDIIEDYELAYRISRKYPVGNLPEYTVLYRVHGTNISIEKKQRLLQLRQEMDEMVLDDLRIPYTKKEWLIHSHFINLNHQMFRDLEQLRELEEWILHFYFHCLQKTGLNKKMLRRILTVRWTIICYRNRHFFRIFHNRLITSFKSDFMKYNLHYIRNRMSGSLEVV